MRFTLRNPRYALGSLFREFTPADERFLSSTQVFRPDESVPTSAEPVHPPDFAARLREADATFRALEIQSADLYAKKGLLQYVLIREELPVF
jgi:hypothetical protein